MELFYMGKIEMNKDKQLILQSLTYMSFVVEFIQNLSFDDFMKDYKLRMSVMFNFIQVGELENKFTSDFVNKYSDINFRDIVGLRNFVVHNYSGVDYELVYDTSINDINTLEKNYRGILESNYNVDDEYISQYIKHYRKTRNFQLNEYK